jgi:hypothetical protein
MRNELDYWRRGRAPWIDFSEEKYYQELLAACKTKLTKCVTSQPVDPEARALEEAFVRKVEMELRRLRQRNMLF